MKVSKQPAPNKRVLTLISLRLRDKHAAELNRQARAVNFVWNYCNEMQQKAVKDGRRWLSSGDLQKLTAGAGSLLDIHSHTIQHVCKRYDINKKTSKKPWLRFRGKKSLGWVPFDQQSVKFNGKTFKFRGVHYETMHMRSFPEKSLIRGGTFSQDGLGRWYINFPIEVTPDKHPDNTGRVIGIDLGLSTLATLSTGEKYEAPQFQRRLEKKRGAAQRANKRRLARKLAIKSANQRRDYLHKISFALTAKHRTIVVGNVSSAKLARTKMAKSVYDAGWSTLRKMLSYKSIRNGGICVEVNEHYTTQTCSACGALPEGRPTGIAGLEIRQWECGGCGAIHDRDVNAALNIVRLGLETLDAGAAQMRSGQLWSFFPEENVRA